MIETSVNIFTDQQLEIIKAVLYFDIFDYPLNSDELFENSAVNLTKLEFTKELNSLLQQHILVKEGDFILSKQASNHCILKREKGNKGAESIMPTAYQYSRKIASFPFVEAICLSGGLSKNYYDENGDIDFFIITKPGRLWICRTLLTLNFKLLPKSKKKYWCINYIISSDNLTIPDRNIFTGTELAYLIPTVNYSVYQNILQQNSWYQNRFPNKSRWTDTNCIPLPSSFLKLCMETMLEGKIGTWLDDVLLRITLKHWRKKYPEMNEEDFELQFRSRKNVCKRHTKGFQNIILNKWNQKQADYETILNVKFT